MKRRDFVTSMAAGLAATGIASAQAPAPAITPVKRKNRIKQGCMRTNFPNTMSFDDMCRIAAEQGIHGFDMIAPNDWPTLKKYGLKNLMGTTGGVGFENGIIRKEFHDALEKSVGANLDQCAAAGIPNMITVGGQRKGMSYEEGADNAVAFFNRVKAHAEDKQVTICMEIMNSKFMDAAIGRWDQICDHLAWGVGVVKRVNSPRVKVLFDIYHVQIMDGDVVHNIRDNIQYVAHFHTGGVPDRHELDETQELNYRFIAQAIVDAGFTGYVSHEYRPAPGHDPVESLKKVMAIMDV
jgi:hydroxypyruvate isomerase